MLTEDEKELGVCLVDMGGGTTDIAIFCGGAIQHTAVIPIAGDQVTNDIAVSLAHAAAVRRGDQDQVRLRVVAAREPRRDDRGAERRRPAAAAARAPDAGRGRRAALRGAVPAHSRGAAPLGIRGAHGRRHRADGRQRQDGRRDRARRRSVPHAGAPRRAAVRRRSFGRRAQPDPRDGSRVCSSTANKRKRPRRKRRRPSLDSAMHSNV